jgi:predicted ester cyclase
MMPAIAELRQFAKRYTVAWCSHQAASVAGFYSPDGTLRINDGAAAEGRSAIAEAAQGFMTAFPDLRVLMDDIVMRGDTAEYQWTLVGTNSGPGGTGQRVRISGSEAWKIGEDGLIAESEGRFDAADYQRQLEGGEEGSK